MDQETFNQMLKEALTEKITFNIIQAPDIYGKSPDQYTIQILFDGEVINSLILNPIQSY
jgi:hypothetical protein